MERSVTTVVRIRAIKKRANPQVCQALDSGQLSVRAANRISKLDPEKQGLELARTIEARRVQAERQATWRMAPHQAKSPYACDSYPECRARRLRRIRRRATPALWEAFESGQLSLHALDKLSSELPPKQQDRWLKNELQRRHQTTTAEH